MTYSNDCYNDILKQINLSINNNFDGHCQVMSGVLADSLYFLKYAQLFEDEESMERAFNILNYHIETATNHILNYKFGHGITGVSWLIAFLNNQGMVDDDILQNFEEIDDCIIKSLDWDYAGHIYDFTIGLIGKAQYLFERGLNSKNRIVIGEIVDFLEKTAIFSQKDNCAWLDHYTSIYNTTDRKTGPYFNLGLGHGTSSIIYFLCKCYKKDIKKDKCEKLITWALNWVINQKEDHNWPYIYPNIVFFEEETTLDKIHLQGWCKGLISTGIAFLFAARTLSSSYYLKKFNEVISASTQILHTNTSASFEELTLTNGATINLGFCHGVTGLVYLYDKLYFLTRNEDCKKMSHYWSKILLDDILVKVPLSNFYNHGILGGLPGLGMALLQKVDEGSSKFDWDKAFLLDIENF